MNILSALSVLLVAASALAKEPTFNCYEPLPGGWHIRLRDGVTVRPDPQSVIGVVPPEADARLYRRPLYPPGEREMVFTPTELAKLQRVNFRPLVLAYHEPRFLFDYHSAGGLLGHLFAGLVEESGDGKWFHQWADIDVRYVNGVMEYTLTDPAFPGVTVRLWASALAHSAGLVLKVKVEGAKPGARLVWAYGGASAFFTNWAMTAPEFAYAPAQCTKDQLRCKDREFLLTRSFDKEDVIMREVFAAPKYLPNWSARIHGGCSWQGRFGLGAPESFAGAPGALLRTADWRTRVEEAGRVAVVEAPLKPAAEGWIVVGMGGDVEQAIHDPRKAWDDALVRNTSIARRIVTHTPDPYLDAALPMMAFATEGAWGGLTMLHGGWSWRFGYLGWRVCYGPDCYGWTDRVRQTILAHVRQGRVTKGPDEGAVGSLIEYSPGVYYNMNEVFLDHVRHYFDYTNDLDFMREIFPVLEGILAWEDRRLQPGQEHLYENALNTWISDQHWYIRGQCTQASAYMLNASRFMADLARRLGRDPAPFQSRAEAIRDAMQRKLWLSRAGVYAEYRDTLGCQLLHAEPELPSLYHSAEFGAADPWQIYQMLHWADTHLGIEKTPGGGKQFWSSRWYPNMQRSYTHSTYEMAYGEELNFAMAHYLVGREDDAYDLIRSSLCGIFNGPTPGGLSCHSYTDGRQRANDEFADAISMWGRAVVEGLFGIVPKAPDGRIELRPQFPSTWPAASIRTPHFAYEWKRTAKAVRLEWTAPSPTGLSLRLPLQASQIKKVRVNGKTARYTLEPGFGLTWLKLETPAARKGTIDVAYAPDSPSPPQEITLRQGEPVRLDAGKGKVTDWKDPQGVLAQARIEGGVLHAIATNDPGPAVVFLADSSAPCPRWSPAHLQIEPRTPPPPPKRWTHPRVATNDLASWTLVDLGAVFNSTVEETLSRVHAAVKPPAEPASGINTAYYQDHLVPPFTPKPSDAAWRKKVGPDGLAWTTEGIPFRTAKAGPNIGVVTRAADVFSPRIEFPVNAAGRALYLMISGTTFAMQSHVVNLRVTLAYADGTEETHDLVHPFTIGDCWNQYRYHDTPANGFENLGGRSGPAGSAGIEDLGRPIAVDTEAHLVAFDLRPDAVLRSIRLEAVANDVVFGVMGATVRK
jgi:hypothetical protein